jgi:hypothetical protein
MESTQQMFCQISENYEEDNLGNVVITYTMPPRISKEQLLRHWVARDEWIDQLEETYFRAKLELEGEQQCHLKKVSQKK